MEGTQGLKDKAYRYHGSSRNFYSGCGLGSTSAWNWISWSGTNTGFGTQADKECQRFGIASSGLSFAQWSFNSGLTIAGEVYGNEAFTFDGVNVSGVWVRAKAQSQHVKIWAW